MYIHVYYNNLVCCPSSSSSSSSSSFIPGVLSCPPVSGRLSRARNHTVSDIFGGFGLLARAYTAPLTSCASSHALHQAWAACPSGTVTLPCIARFDLAARLAARNRVEPGAAGCVCS